MQVEISDSQPTVLLGNTTSTDNGTTTSTTSDAVLADAAAQSARLSSLAASIATLANAGGLQTIGDLQVLAADVSVPPPPASVATYIAAVNNATNTTNATGGSSGTTVVPPIVFAFPTPSTSLSSSVSLTATQAATPTQTLSVGASPSQTATVTRTASQTASATPTPSQTASTLVAAASGVAASTVVLSSGAVAGIVIACVVVVALIAALVFLLRPMRRLKVVPSDEPQPVALADSTAPARDPSDALEREQTLTTHVTIVPTPKAGAARSTFDLKIPRRGSNCDLAPVNHQSIETAPLPSGPASLSSAQAMRAPAPALPPLSLGQDGTAPHIDSPAAANGIVAAASARNV